MITADVSILEDGRPLKEIARAIAVDQWIVRWIQRLRSDHAEIDDQDPIFLREIDQHIAAAAEAAHPRFDDRDGKGSCDCGVDGIPAFAKNLRANLRRYGVLAGDRAARTCRMGFTEIPVLGVLWSK